MENNAVVRKDKIMQLTTTKIELEAILLTKICLQEKKNIR